MKVNFANADAINDMNISGFTQNVSFAAGNWSDDEIRQVDLALGFMHRLLDSRVLLRTSSGAELTFTRVGTQTEGPGLDGLNGGGTIRFMDTTFTSGEDDVMTVVFHEVGHNWDEENGKFEQWKALSGWTQTDPHDSTRFVKGGDQDTNWWHRRTANFVQNDNYDQQNPYEDFACAFSAYMMNRAGKVFTRGPGISAAPDKGTFIDNFVNGLGS